MLAPLPGAESNQAGDVTAESWNPKSEHRCREIVVFTPDFITAASCGALSNMGVRYFSHFYYSLTSKVMRRRGGLWFNYGASRRRIHRLVRSLGL